MADGREEREELEIRRKLEQQEKEQRAKRGDRFEPPPPDQWEPERDDS